MSKSDPHTLARQIVEARLAAPDDWYAFLAPAARLGADDTGTDWKALLDAIGTTARIPLAPTYDDEYGRLAKLLTSSDLEDKLLSVTECATQAGFLVGLELGRRLGGTR